MTTRSLLHCGAVLLLSFMTNTLGIAFVANAATVPSISYQTSGGAEERRLIFVNNPEEIHAEAKHCDVADSITVGGTGCAKSILRIHGASGRYRDWWEHSNKTGRILQYGVRIYNPGQACVEVTVRGAGFTLDAVRNGGKEFVQLFSKYDSGWRGFGQSVQVCPGQVHWLFRSPSSQPITNEQYFAGVVDFDISGGKVIIDNLAFFTAPAPTTKYMGYTSRVMGKGTVHESLVYKGVSTATEALAVGVDFEVDDDDAPQRLRVSYPTYVMPVESDPPAAEAHCRVLDGHVSCSGDEGHFSAKPSIFDHWVTHIAPNPRDANSRRSRAILTDIVKLYMPGLPASCTVEDDDPASSCFQVSPFYKWYYPDFGDWLYPNWGNWVVHYKLRGTITNRGGRTRHVHLGLRADGNSPIAFKGQDNVWRHKFLTQAGAARDDYFPYSYITSPPGEKVPFQGDMILSGPGAGTFEQLAVLAD